MKFTIPQPLQNEHEALHERLRQATEAGGEVGEAAKTLARLMHPHFVKEDQFALPPLGLLVALARGETNAEMAEVLDAHRPARGRAAADAGGTPRIVEALNKLREAQRVRAATTIVAFAEALVEHAQTEEAGDVPGRHPGRPGGAAAPGPARRGARLRMSAMKTPAFFDAVAPIAVTDPLADAAGRGRRRAIEYRYLDAVKLAGHSCPTVAGAWLMTRTALARLYPGQTPQRGGIRVELRQAVDEGVAGVIASVAGLITGAANDGGFKGLAGRFGGRACCDSAWPMAGEIRFTRLDNGVVGRTVAPSAGGASADRAGGPDARRPGTAGAMPRHACLCRGLAGLGANDPDRACRRPGADHRDRLNVVRGRDVPRRPRSGPARTVDVQGFRRCTSEPSEPGSCAATDVFEAARGYVISVPCT